MAVSIPDFWKLLVASRLAAASSLPKLQEMFSQVKGAETQGNSVTLAQWLVSQGVISKYQAKVLLAGHAGPFMYGEYTVYDRFSSGRLQGAFRAIHPPTRVRVVLWFHSGAAVQNSQCWSIIVEQAAQLARAVHPHLARVYHLCDHGQFKFTVVEDLQGESSGELLAKGPIPWAAACRMIRQVSQGLSKLIEMGQLHGSIRPSNIWINSEENAKLLLPPLARDPLMMPGPINLATAPTEELMRQADYLAPELAQAGQAPNPRTEVYALGCTLFHMLTRRPPFSGRDPLSKLASHETEKIPALDASLVPALVGQALAGMMAKDPARRYQNPRQVADALGQVLQKLDQAQLRWPASRLPTKLPEYESWLQPYRVAADSQGHFAPEIDVPPILAASLPLPQAAPPVEIDPDGMLAPEPIPAASAAATISSATRARSSADASVAAPPQSPKPALQTGAGGKAAVNTSPPPVRQPANRSAGAGAAATPSAPVAAMSQMIFPPEQEHLVPFAADHQRRGKKKPPVFVMGGIMVAVVALGIVISQAMSKKGVEHPFSDGKSSDKSGTAASAGAQQPDVAGSENTKNNPSAGGSGAAENGNAVSSKPGTSDSSMVDATPNVISENGRLLWMSPTTGSPISLGLLPPAVQVIFILRPADLLHHPDGEKLLAALGPDAVAARHEIEALAGASLVDIEQLTVAWAEPVVGGATANFPLCIARFSQPQEKSKLLLQWGNPAPATVGEETTFVTSQGFTVFLPTKEQGKVLVFGSSELVAEAASLSGEPPLRRDLEKLLLKSDAQRVATCVWLPTAAGDTGVFSPSPSWSKLLIAARSLFGDDCRSAAVSVQLSQDNVFIELREVGPLERTPDEVARQLRQRLTQLPAAVEGYIASLNLQPYGRHILLRFPQMLRMVDEFTRAGSENDQAVLRCYLPVVAAHNLLLGTELALAEGIASPAVDPKAHPADSPAAQSVVQKLKRVTTLSFPNENLEKALHLLADDIGVTVEILGGDLQLDGITKNQPIRDLDEKNKPAEEILRVIMRKANPDGKLVYVIRPKDVGSDETLLITTRAASAKRGDKLPPELVAAPKGK